MNKRIRELVEQCETKEVGYYFFDREKFAELIIKEHINLLKREWYVLNSAPEVENESPRDIGLRVGKKAEIIVLTEKIKQYFGVEE